MAYAQTLASDDTDATATIVRPFTARSARSLPGYGDTAPGGAVRQAVASPAARCEALVDRYVAARDAGKPAWEQAGLLKEIARVFRTELDDERQAFDAYLEAMRALPIDYETIAAVEELARAQDRWAELIDTAKATIAADEDDRRQRVLATHLARWVRASEQARDAKIDHDAPTCLLAPSSDADFTMQVPTGAASSPSVLAPTVKLPRVTPASRSATSDAFARALIAARSVTWNRAVRWPASFTPAIVASFCVLLAAATTCLLTVGGVVLRSHGVASSLVVARVAASTAAAAAPPPSIDDPITVDVAQLPIAAADAPKPPPRRAAVAHKPSLRPVAAKKASAKSSAAAAPSTAGFLIPTHGGCAAGDPLCANL